MDDLSCKVCWDEFGESAKCPRVLNCGHTFCESCLKITLSSEDRKCPTCRAGIANRNVCSFPVNFVAKGLTSPAEKAIKYSNTRKVLTDLIKSELCYAEKEYEGVKRYGKLTYKDRCVWVNSFKPEKPAAVYIPFEDIINKFGGSNGRITTKGFLKIANCIDELGTQDSDDDSDGFYIVIDTDGETSRAKNFLFLCSGHKGRSYKGGVLADFQESPTGCYEMREGPPPVVQNTIDLSDTDHQTPMKKGDVFGMTEEECGFNILMGDCSWNMGPKFGEVIYGLQGMGAESCRIVECGLIF